MRSSLRTRTRAWSGVAAGAALATSIAAAPVAASADEPAAEPAGTLTDLGVAMHAPNVRLSDVDVLADGTPVAYVFSDGEPVSFNVIDLRTGELIDSHAMPPYTVASSIDIADDDTVYLSVRSPNDGTLWRYEPETGALVEIATGVAGEQMLRTLDIDGDTLYGTTYPNATLYAMDLATEKFTEYGPLTSQGNYAWGLEAHDGRIWAGAGTPAQLYDVDPADGTTTPVDLPDTAARGDFIQRIETHGDLTLVSHRTVDGVNVQLHNGATWVDTLRVRGLWLYTEQSTDGVFYYLDASNQPHAYDIATRTSSAVDLSGTGLADEIAGTSRVFLADLGTAEFPGSTLIGVRTDGAIWRYSLDTGAADVLQPEPFGSPVTTMSIAEGGDGHVYVGAYLSPGVMARVDTSTGEIEQLDGPEQADSIVAHGDQTVIGSYPDAAFHVADAGEPWAWGDNPRHVLTLGRQDSGQDRPRHMVSAGDVVAAGTIADYGELGGALTLFDPDTGDYDLHRDIVEDQSISALAYADGVVYAGTSIHGGLSSEPTQDTAELITWDVNDGLISHAPVVDDATVVHALTVDGLGRVWGMSDTGTLFEYDPAAGEVVQRIETGLAHGNIWGSGSELDYHPGDDMIYGSASGKLFRFDPDTADVDGVEILLDESVRRATLVGDDVYLTDETNVYRYEPAPVCDETVSGSHAGPLVLDDGTTCVVEADLEGPLTVSSGASVVLRESTLEGPLRSDGARQVTVGESALTGPVSITGTTGAVVLRNTTINGPLSCGDNTNEPSDRGTDTTVSGPSTGQCSHLG